MAGRPRLSARELRMPPPAPDETFRGRRVLRAHSWVGLDDTGAAVAKIGGDVYDEYLGAGPAMGLAYVTDPARWGRGHGRAALRAVVAHPDVADVRLFSAGIEPANAASVRCAAAAGFSAEGREPDAEGIVYHVFRVPS